MTESSPHKLKINKPKDLLAMQFKRTLKSHRFSSQKTHLGLRVNK